MRTRVGVFAANLVESGWLAAVAVVPIFFNVYTVRIFEEEKVPLFRSIALAISAALIVHLLESRAHAAGLEGSVAARLRAVWRLPAARLALLLAGASVLSTVCSLRPVVSLWGGYLRSQGSYTLFCYLAVFFALLTILRGRDQLERLIAVMLLASVPPALYAIAQSAGADPIGWVNVDQTRSTSTSGNAIFVAAFMVMMVPLTLARCLEHAERLRRLPHDDPGRGAVGSFLLLHLMLLALQLLTIVLTQSRGPVGGLVAGVTVFFLAAAFQRRARWVAFATAGAIVAGGLFVWVLNIPQGPLQGIRTAPYVARFAQMNNSRFSSFRVRLIVWQASVNLLKSDPVRFVTGYGADTLYLAYRPFLSAELARHETKNVVPDRAHNATYDAFISNGVFGGVAEIGFVVAVLFAGLTALGAAAPGRRRKRLVLLLIGGAAGGALLPCLFEGGSRFLAPGLALGIVAAVVVHLLIGSAAREAAAPATARPLLLIGLIGGLVAHFVEIQAGIPVVATRLYFWIYAALILLLAVPLVGADAPEGADASARQPEPWLAGDLVSVIPTVGLVLVVLCANFHRQGFDPARNGGALGFLFGGVWLVGAAFVMLDAGKVRERAGRLITYGATTAGLCLLFLALYGRSDIGLTSRSTLDEVRAAAVASSWRIAIVHGFVLFVIAMHATVSYLRENTAGLSSARAAGLAVRPPAWRAAVYVLLAAALVPLVTWTNLTGSRADVIAKRAFAHERAKQWAAAVALHAEALRLRPWEDRYAMNLGGAWLDLAQAEPESNTYQRRIALTKGLEAFELAERLSPLDPDHPRNLGRLHREWTRLAADEDERQEHLQSADRLYLRATELMPHSGALWADWAMLWLERGESQRALSILDRSVEVDPEYTTAYWLRGNLRIARGELEAGLADYDRALEVNPDLLPALSAKAIVLSRLGRVDEAIAVTKYALLVHRRDPISWNNLIMLTEQKGKRARARKRAEQARRLVPVEHRAMFDEWIAKLQ